MHFGSRRITTAVSAAGILACSSLLAGCDPVTVIRCSVTALLESAEADSQPDDTQTVTATVETEPVDDPCDAADDPAIWLNEEDPEASLIVATNKVRGLLVYDLEGQIVSRLDSGRVNNVDLRSGIRVGGAETIVVAGTNRTTMTLDILALDPASGELSPLGDPIDPEFADEPYGLCLYHSAASGDLYVFANAQDGAVGQWRLDGDGRGGLTGVQVREWTLASQPEGCVADDANGWLFIGEEEAAIWRFDAEPTASTDRPTVVDRTTLGEPGGGRLAADVEGLALYVPPGGGARDGFLVASSQGNHTYVVYDRAPPHAYRGTFRVGGGGAVDGTEETDGIDLVAAPVGPDYPAGLLVVQDGFNYDSEGSRINQNFKFVSWADLSF
ncbi:MAG: phytase [Acidobacteria bacterium]|nr:phytase [Acidobacteriota bacterium]